ncbi:ArsS family sensor histidine kinase [Nitrosophilus kaiyonis]|uniref:ArsS family sensor histidine kinase n=1 Tax=Nitrosophilus kaiyonis TaxID=2930200 RepID=UPI0024923CB1|nr:ArsS family sensor histidine kinase [Nitrosophilus kaiyonis]
MKRSIFFSITFIFLIAFLAITASFYLFLKYEKINKKTQIDKRFEFISNTLPWKLQNIKNPNKLIKELKKIDLEPIFYAKEAINILKNSKKIKKISSEIGDIWLLKYKNENYIFIQSFGNSLLLKDLSSLEIDDFFIYFIFSIVILLIFLVYIGVILKLRPLKKIENELKKFSKGEMNLNLDIKGSSEITEVAKNLKNSIDAVKNMLNSRKLLLRNIMHELKTPITKGRIVAEMVENEKQRNRLISIFERLNSLINEIAAIESIDSKIQIKKVKKNIKDFLQEAINLGLFDKKQIIIKYYDNPQIEADYKLFSIALKNLIENGIKYSQDNQVKIAVYKDKIDIINKGKPLKKEFNYYLEPFTKEGKNSGFGLGLYLVNSILKLHNFKLSYKYSDNRNIFIIHLY